MLNWRSFLETFIWWIAFDFFLVFHNKFRLSASSGNCYRLQFTIFTNFFWARGFIFLCICFTLVEGLIHLKSCHRAFALFCIGLLVMDCFSSLWGFIYLMARARVAVWRGLGGLWGWFLFVKWLLLMDIFFYFCGSSLSMASSSGYL